MSDEAGGEHNDEADAALHAALEKLAATETLLVALDFDGTLAPFVDDPQHARATPEARAAIVELAALPRTIIAYISGRPIASLARLAEAGPADLLIGSHGVETRLDGEHAELALEQSERERLSDLDGVLEAVVAANEGAHIERKPAGIAFHTRGMQADAAAAAEAAARRAAQDAGGGFTVRGGKSVVEFAVRGQTKGDGVRRLRAHTEASAVLFAGDDVTDEDGFRALGGDDVGIKVGEGETLAAYRVADTDALAAALAQLAALRRAAL
ncbi:trehalose-phosphatase [Microbacterium sp. STN6]|uniref:trehalose-phosphatase n=1 Tax=Microbacterium sp. STN6 TaxID=2995588 RepID=UPI0022609442|nr:trehalose-phosphatase [Microbacterium sp. STN6]MCX7522037.1 trehalose-phosphatase [Microbacterium sp. STN6]